MYRRSVETDGTVHRKWDVYEEKEESGSENIGEKWGVILALRVWNEVTIRVESISYFVRNWVLVSSQ